METNSFVSILIPNYNKSPYLRETLDSVLAQTYTNWECIIVDDHSTDSSWEILKEYAIKDIRFKIHRRPVDRKKGGNAARNYAIELAKGEFVAFLDSDDLWYASRLQRAMNFIEKHNSLSIFSGALVIRPEGVVKLKSRNIREGESIFDFILSNDVFCPTPSLILNKKILDGVRFDENMIRHQDYDFFIRAHLIQPSVYFENFDVVVNWTRPNLKKVNYFDCIPFYEKHSALSKEKNIRIRYIKRITSNSVRNNYRFNLSNYYKEVLLSEGYEFSFKDYLLFFQPYCFWMMSKLKWSIFSLKRN